MTAPRIFSDAEIHSVSPNCIEPSASSDGSLSFSTYANLAKLSTNAGGAFPHASSAVEVFPAQDGGNHNFDQDTVWIKPVQRFAWSTLTVVDAAGRSRIRIAVASSAGINARDAAGTWRGGSWMWFEILPEDIGLQNAAFDHPHLGYSNGHLYWSAYFYTRGTSSVAGFCVMRVSIAQLRELVAKTITFQFFTMPIGADAMSLSYPPEHAYDRSFFLLLRSPSDRARLLWWDDNSGQIFGQDLKIPSYDGTQYASMTPGPGGADWLNSCWARVCGAAVVDFAIPGQPREIYFAWTAGRDQTFPHPNIYVLSLEQDRANDKVKVMAARRIWHRDHAWALPALAIGGQRRLAMACALGGGLHNVHFNVGYLQWPLTENSSYENWNIARSNIGEMRWGDYIKVRDISPTLFRARFAATGYVTLQDGGSPPTIRAHAHYVVFGDDEE